MKRSTKISTMNGEGNEDCQGHSTKRLQHDKEQDKAASELPKELSSRPAQPSEMSRNSIDRHDSPYLDRHPQVSRKQYPRSSPDTPRLPLSTLSTQSPERYPYMPPTTYSHHGTGYYHSQGGRPPSPPYYDSNGMVALSPPARPDAISMMSYPYQHPAYHRYPPMHWAPVSPVEYILQIQPNDVLSGRGGATNSHSGNRAFRVLVKKYQDQYLKAKKRDKPAVASIIVQKIRDKGGRFLKRVDTPPDGQVLWIDIGDERAKEKACQALREGAPEIRRKGKVPIKDSGDGDDEDDEKKSRDDSGNLSGDSDVQLSNDDGSRFSTKRTTMMRDVGQPPPPAVASWHHPVPQPAAAPIMIRPSPALLRRRIPEAISVDQLDPLDREIYLRDFLPPDPRIRKAIGKGY